MFFLRAFGFFICISIVVNAQNDFRAIHNKAIVVDGHNDVLMRVIKGESIEKRTQRGHSDLVRFKEGGLDVQVFSIWVPPSYSKKGSLYEYALREIDSLDAIIKRNPSRIAKVTSEKELTQAMRRGALAAIYSIEGLHPAEGSLERIRTLYKRGVRSFGLTWNNSNAWASSSKDEANGKSIGITNEGWKLIALIDSLGGIFDISHSGPATIATVLDKTKNPIIASHSSSSSLRNHHRNLTDEQLKRITENDGVVMVNFYPGFIVSGMPRNVKQQLKVYEQKLDALAKKHTLDSKTYLQKRDKLILKARNNNLPTVLDVVDHIMHIVKVAGIDHVGLGSDFDGIGYAPLGIHDVTQLPYLTRELLKQGLNEESIGKILGGNFVRIFSQICR